MSDTYKQAKISLPSWPQSPYFSETDDKTPFPSHQLQRHLVLHFHCCSESFVTPLLFAGNHPAHIDVVVGEDLPGFLDGGVRQGSCSAQDPGKVNVEEPQDIRAGIHQGGVHVVSGQYPIRGVGQDCGVQEHRTRSKADHLQCFLLM